MIQFYISSGVVIASLLLQFIIVRTAIHIKNTISTDPMVRVKPKELTGTNSLKIFKMIIILSSLLLIWSLVLIILYKELLIGIVFLGLLIAVIGYILIVNNIISSVGFRNEVQIAKIEKMNFEVSEEDTKKLKKQDFMFKLAVALLGLSNTVALIVGYTMYNDSLWFTFVNILFISLMYFIIYNSLNLQHKIIFSYQEGALTKEEVKSFLKESKDKYSISKNDIKDLLEKEPSTDKK